MFRSRKIRGLQSRASTKISWPGGSRHSPFLPAGTVQGQRRAVRGRASSSQSGQDRSVNMATARKAARQRVHQRIRKKVAGTADRPRLAVHFSGKHIYAQVIDDDAGRTLASASTMEGSLLGDNKSAANRAAAEQIGKTIAERLLGQKLDRVVFDRGGFLYHGKVKALADAARANGLRF